MKTRTIKTTPSKKVFDKRFIAFGLIAALCLIPGICRAQDSDQASPSVLASPDVAGRKLKRGFHNLLLGWIEIPKGIESIGSQHGVGAAATLGFLHGAGRAIQRTATGVFDVLTFPLDTGDGYGSMIESEFDAAAKPAEPNRTEIQAE
ncbi:MAG: exosortase system-associated protein, TIGR04073 family [Candidatus Omnitrophica bacterium]|nr:exosortase system-associated protein, TIGR04073 family [Candidatus Omnitrophota bacterium]